MTSIESKKVRLSYRAKKVRLLYRAKKYDFHLEQKSTTLLCFCFAGSYINCFLQGILHPLRVSVMASHLIGIQPELGSILGQRKYSYFSFTFFFFFSSFLKVLVNTLFYVI